MSTATRNGKHKHRPAPAEAAFCNLDAERGLLAGMVADETIIPEVRRILGTAAAFWNDVNQEIARAAFRLVDQGRPVDVTLLIEEMGFDPDGNYRGPVKGLTRDDVIGVLASAITSNHATEYALVVAEKHRLRLAAEATQAFQARLADSARSVDELVAELRGKLQEIERDAPRADDFDLGLIGTEAFLAESYRLEWLIKGVIVADQACVFGGPQKTLKTSIIIDQAISLGSGTPFLGRFDVPEPIPCMVVSGESGKAVIQANAREIAQARGLDPRRVLVHWGFEPPQLCNPRHIEVVRRAIAEHGFRFVVFDPLYLSLLAGNSGIDPKDMFQMGPLLADVAAACLDAGATPELCHHFVKRREDPWGPPDMADLAYAGIGQFMRQWLLTSRRERYNPEEGVHRLHFTYGGSAGHSGEMHLDIATGTVGEDFQGRKWEVMVVPPTVARLNREQEQKAEAEQRREQKERQKAAERERALTADMEAVEELLRSEPERRATARRIRDLTGWNNDKASHVLARLERDGRVRPAKFDETDSVGRKQSKSGFALVELEGGVL